MKIKTGKGTRYFYSIKEYIAYLNNKKKTSVFDKIEGILKKFGSKRMKDLKKKVDVGKSFVDKMFDDLKDRVSKDNYDEQKPKKKPVKKHKYLYKEKLPNGRTRYFYSEGEYQAYLKKLKYQTNEPDFMKHVKETSDFSDANIRILTEEDDSKVVNDKYDVSDWAYSTNCALSTAAYELRRRGYDVEAAPANHEIQHDQDIEDRWFKGGKSITLNKGVTLSFPGIKKTGYVGQSFDTDKDVDRVTKEILKHNPPGSRGDLSFVWKGVPSGHSVVYEVTKTNKVVIRDTQDDTVYSLSDLKGQVNEMRSIRRDNLELKPEIKEVFNEK